MVLSLLCMSLSSSPGSFPPLYLASKPSTSPHSPPHYISLFLSSLFWFYELDVLFLLYAPIHHFKSKVEHAQTASPPLPPSVSSLGWAEGHSHQQSIRAQWQELCCSNRVQCADLGATEAEYREVQTGLTPPADKQYCSFHPWCEAKYGGS